MENLNELYEAILAGKLAPAVEITKKAVAEGLSPNVIINDYMVKAMEEIGRRFEEGKVFVPNLLISARAMRGALDILKPLLKGDPTVYLGKIAIARSRVTFMTLAKTWWLRCLRAVALK